MQFERSVWFRAVLATIAASGAVWLCYAAGAMSDGHRSVSSFLVFGFCFYGIERSVRWLVRMIAIGVSPNSALTDTPKSGGAAR